MVAVRVCVAVTVRVKVRLAVGVRVLVALGCGVTLADGLAEGAGVGVSGTSKLQAASRAAALIARSTIIICLKGNLITVSLSFH